LTAEQRTLFPDPPPGAASETEIAGDDWTFLRTTTAPAAPAKAGKTVRLIDLFCGCGGLSLGVREACRSLGLGLEVALAVDSDEPAAACFERNFPGAAVRQEDVGRILTGRLGARATARESDWAAAGAIDLLVGGPPCQGHSDLNNFSRRSDPKNDLYLYMGRAAEVWRPRHVLVENVVGVANAKQEVVRRVAERLAALGYFVDEGIVDLWRVGVPQSRRRHVLLASTARRLRVKQIERRYETALRGLRWAIGDLEDARPDTLLDAAAVTSADNRRRIDYLFDHGLHDLPDEQRPPCHRDKKHSYGSIYGRLRWDRPAQTITTGFYSMPMGRYVHPSRRRTLTAHEAARLQFFPDSFDFSGVKNRSGLARLIGNAAPPKLSYVLARELFLPEAAEA
jgi:DNA (cytosine-5)-methyltransferase 1